MVRVFVSYASGDAALAMQVVAKLEGREVICWIAPRDIPGGAAYTDTLFEALRDCQAVVVLCSPRSNASNHVLRELELSARFDKRIIPLTIDGYSPNGGMAYLLAGLQQVPWMQDRVSTQVDQIVAALVGPVGANKLDPTCEELVRILTDAGLTHEEARRVVLSLERPIAACSNRSSVANLALLHVFERLPPMESPERQTELHEKIEKWVDKAFAGDEARAWVIWPMEGEPLDRTNMDVVRRLFHNSRNPYAGGGPHPQDSQLEVGYCVRPGVRVFGPNCEPGGTVPAWVAVRRRDDS